MLSRIDRIANPGQETCNLAESDHLHEDAQSVKETQPSKMMDREADGR